MPICPEAASKRESVRDTYPEAESEAQSNRRPKTAKVMAKYPQGRCPDFGDIVLADLRRDRGSRYENRQIRDTTLPLGKTKRNKNQPRPNVAHPDSIIIDSI